jgi:hypothetical protein
MSIHTVSASVNSPGWIQHRQGDTTTIAYWAWELRSVYTPIGETGAHLTFKAGYWLRTSASVDDVLVALGAASKIWLAVERQKTSQDGLPHLDAQTRDAVDEASMPVPSSFVDGIF